MTQLSNERLDEMLARVSPPAEGWRAGLPTMDVHSALTELQTLRASSGVEVKGSEKAAVEIGDAVLSWMVKHDLLDADLEYQDDDVIEALDGLLADDSPLPTVEVTEGVVAEAYAAAEAALKGTSADIGRGELDKIVRAALAALAQNKGE